MSRRDATTTPIDVADCGAHSTGSGNLLMAPHDAPPTRFTRILGRPQHLTRYKGTTHHTLLLRHTKHRLEEARSYQR